MDGGVGSTDFARKAEGTTPLILPLPRIATRRSFVYCRMPKADRKPEELDAGEVCNLFRTALRGGGASGSFESARQSQSSLVGARFADPSCEIARLYRRLSNE